MIKLSSCSDCYEVFASPIESPYYGERTTVVSPAHPVASPYGWHDINGDIVPESFKTSGNNVLAFSDNSGDTYYQPNGGAELSFVDFPFDEIFSEMDPYTDASVTNSFYWANVMHDVMYQYGFDEDAGNFQENNYGRGGEGHDPIRVVGQSSGRPCNAFFAAGPDGYEGFIGVSICNDKDGNFDNIVVLHEYGHGVSNRLVCGNAVNYCLNNKEQMGEGWSDIYALILTMSPDDTDEDPRGIATYLLGQGPNGNGGRSYPYTTNTSINPYTYDSIKTVGYPHGVGTIWATMLWELTWNLINEHGFNPDVYNFTGDFNTDAGNIMMLAIITEAMKFMDAAPGFVDARDAILEADLAIYDGKNQCLIWDAFIKRGLGYGASQGSTYHIDDGRESFESFPEEATFEIETENVCLIKGVLKGLRGGYPYGGIFSGQGVLDDGNGYSYTFDPQLAGIGTHEITYELFDTNCTVASSYMDTVTVFFDEESPQIVCPEDIELTIPANQKGYTMIQFYSQENIDSCNPVPEYTQDPVPGTLIGPGNNEITIYATIPNGDRSSCVFNIKVLTKLGEEYNSMSIYPNPSSEEITVLSRIELENTEILIWDISGKQVKKFNFSSFGFEKSLLIDDLARGVYFINLDSEIYNSVEKMIKL